MAKDEIDFDDIEDFDDNIDNFDESGFGEDIPGANSKSPIKRLSMNFAASAAKSFATEDALKKFASNAMPKGYATSLDTVLQARDAGMAIYDEAKIELKRALPVMRKAAGFASSATNKFLPKAVAEKLQAFAEGKDDSYYERSQSDYDNETISESLGEIFSTQMEEEARQREEDQVREDLTAKVADKRAVTAIDIQRQILSKLDQQTSFQDKVFSKTLQKGLEIQYRQMFYQRDMLALIAAGEKRQDKQLQVIMHNTSLPDSRKRDLIGMVKGNFKDSLINRLQTGSVERATNFIGKLGTRLKDTVKNTLSSAIMHAEGLIDQGDMLDGAGEMGMNKSDAVAQLAGSEVGDFAVNRASKFLGKLLGKNEGLKKFGSKLQYYLGDPASAAAAFKKRDITDTGFKGIIGKMVQDFLPDVENDYSVGKNSLETAMDATGFDMQSRKSLVEVIPGFLSRIHQEIVMIRTKSDKAERVVFNYDQDAFTSFKEADKDVRSRVLDTYRLKEGHDAAIKFANALDKDGALDWQVKRELKRRILLNSIQGLPFDPKDYEDIIDVSRFYTDEAKTKLDYTQVADLNEEFKSIKEKIDNPTQLLNALMQAGLQEHIDQLSFVKKNGKKRTVDPEAWVEEILKTTSLDEEGLRSKEEADAKLAEAEKKLNIIGQDDLKKIKGQAGEVWNKTKDKAKEFSQTAWEKTKEGASVAKEKAGELADSYAQGGVKGLVDTMRTMGKDAFNSLISSAKGMLNAAKLRAGEYYDQISGKMISKLGDIKGPIVDKLGNIVASVNDIINNWTADSPKIRAVIERVKAGAVTGYNKTKELAKTGYTKGKTAVREGATAIKDKFIELKSIYQKDGLGAAFETAKLQAGEYYDQNSGKVIESLKDIKGAIVDKSGNIVASAKDIANNWVSDNPRVQAVINRLAQDTEGVRGKIKVAATKTKATAIRAKDRVKSEIDELTAIYKADGSGAMFDRAKILAGEYRDQASGAIIQSVKDIKGTIVDSSGNVIARASEIANEWLSDHPNVQNRLNKIAQSEGAQKVKSVATKGFTKTKSAALAARDKVKEALGQLSSIYTESSGASVFEHTKLKAGEYYDQVSGTVIKHFKDIKGDIVDKSGNVVARASDIIDNWTSDKPEVQKAISKLITNLSKVRDKTTATVGSVTSKVKSAINRTTPKSRAKSTKASKETGSQGKARAQWKKLASITDTRTGQPVLDIDKLKQGFYIDQDTGVAIRTVKDITGDILDTSGNVIARVSEMGEYWHSEDTQIRQQMDKVIKQKDNILADDFDPAKVLTESRQNTSLVNTNDNKASASRKRKNEPLGQSSLETSNQPSQPESGLNKILSNLPDLNKSNIDPKTGKPRTKYAYRTEKKKLQRLRLTNPYIEKHFDIERMLDGQYKSFFGNETIFTVDQLADLDDNVFDNETGVIVYSKRAALDKGIGKQNDLDKIKSNLDVAKVPELIDSQDAQPEEKSKWQSFKDNAGAKFTKVRADAGRLYGNALSQADHLKGKIKTGLAEAAENLQGAYQNVKGQLVDAKGRLIDSTGRVLDQAKDRLSNIKRPHISFLERTQRAAERWVNKGHKPVDENYIPTVGERQLDPSQRSEEWKGLQAATSPGRIAESDIVKINKELNKNKNPLDVECDTCTVLSEIRDHTVQHTDQLNKLIELFEKGLIVNGEATGVGGNRPGFLRRTFGSFGSAVGRGTRAIGRGIGSAARAYGRFSLGVIKAPFQLAGAVARGIGKIVGIGKDYLGDICNNKGQVLLYRKKIKEGAYVNMDDKRTPIKGLKDVKGAVLDISQDPPVVVLTQEEFEQGLFDTQGKKLGNKFLGMLGSVASGAMGLLGSAAKGYFQFAALPFKAVGWAARGISKLVSSVLADDDPVDLYLKDDLSKPVVTVKEMQEGKVFNADKKSLIKHQKDIKGPVYKLFKTRVREVISQEDLQEGNVVDFTGKKVKIGKKGFFGRMIGGAMDLAGSALGLLGKAAALPFKLIGGGIKLAGNLLSGGMKRLGNWVNPKNRKGDASTATVIVLQQILGILEERLKKPKKIRKGSWMERMANDGKGGQDITVNVEGGEQKEEQSWLSKFGGMLLAPLAGLFAKGKSLLMGGIMSIGSKLVSVVGGGIALLGRGIASVTGMLARGIWGLTKWLGAGLVNMGRAMMVRMGIMSGASTAAGAVGGAGVGAAGTAAAGGAGVAAKRAGFFRRTWNAVRHSPGGVRGKLLAAGGVALGLGAAGYAAAGNSEMPVIEGFDDQNGGGMNPQMGMDGFDMGMPGMEGMDGFDMGGEMPNFNDPTFQFANPNVNPTPAPNDGRARFTAAQTTTGINTGQSNLTAGSTGVGTSTQEAIFATDMGRQALAYGARKVAQRQAAGIATKIGGRLLMRAATGAAISGPAAPIVSTALVVADIGWMIGTAAWKKAHYGQFTPLRGYRVTQYGADFEDSDQGKKLAVLEELLEPYVKPIGGGKNDIIVDDSDIMKQAREIFEIDLDDEESGTYRGRMFGIWFNQRFRPVFINWVTALRNIQSAKQTTLLDADDDLTDKERLAVLKLVHENVNEDIYDQFRVMPFEPFYVAGPDSPIPGSELVETAYKRAIAEASIELDKGLEATGRSVANSLLGWTQSDSVWAKVGRVGLGLITAGTSELAIAGMNKLNERAEERRNEVLNDPDKMRMLLDRNEGIEFKDGRLEVKSETLELILARDLRTFEAIRMLVYGLKEDFPEAKVKMLLEMEKQIMEAKDVLEVKDGKTKFKISATEALVKFGAIFGVRKGIIGPRDTRSGVRAFINTVMPFTNITRLLPDSDADRWVYWFNYRFAPAFLSMVSGFSALDASANPLEADQKCMDEPNQKLNARALAVIARNMIELQVDREWHEVGNWIGDNSIWAFTKSPWPEDKRNPLNTDKELADLLVDQITKEISGQDERIAVETRSGSAAGGQGKFTEEQKERLRRALATMGASEMNIGGRPLADPQAPSEQFANPTPTPTPAPQVNRDLSLAQPQSSQPYTGGISGVTGIPFRHPGSGEGGDINSIPMPSEDYLRFGSNMPISQRAQEAAPIINEASKMVGVDPKIMMNMAAIESGFKPTVGATTSSAKGLYQFINSTWETMLKRYGDKYGLSENASPLDPRANALMGAEFLKENYNSLRPHLNRQPNDTDMYTAHFMGAGGAKKLLTAPEEANAVAMFPSAANANQSIFYRNGRPKTVKEVYAELDRRMGNHRQFIQYLPEENKSADTTADNNETLASPATSMTIFDGNEEVTLPLNKESSQQSVTGQRPTAMTIYDGTSETTMPLNQPAPTSSANDDWSMGDGMGSGGSAIMNQAVASGAATPVATPTPPADNTATQDRQAEVRVATQQQQVAQASQQQQSRQEDRSNRLMESLQSQQLTELKSINSNVVEVVNVLKSFNMHEFKMLLANQTKPQEASPNPNPNNPVNRGPWKTDEQLGPPVIDTSRSTQNRQLYGLP